MARALILVVEDEFIIAKNLQVKLESLGYEVCGIAPSGAKAIEIAERSRPDLVLMDILLKGSMDGISAAIAIRHFGIPVVYITAYADQEMLDRAKVTEPFGYLLKPINERELQASIEMALYKAGIDARLNESEERFRTLADFTYDWEYWIGPDGRFVYISPSCERITGYGPDEFLAEPALITDIIHPDDQAGCHDFLGAGWERLGPVELECRIVCKNGEVRWIGHCSQPIHSPSGEWRGRRGSNRDLTKLKLAEQEQARLIKELEEALTRVKKLSGLLPICSVCKKIRDDQGYWQQLEAFIRERSDADFSHGICPDCAKDLYPELFSDR